MQDETQPLNAPGQTPPAPVVPALEAQAAPDAPSSYEVGSAPMAPAGNTPPAPQSSSSTTEDHRSILERIMDIFNRGKRPDQPQTPQPPVSSPPPTTPPQAS